MRILCDVCGYDEASFFCTADDASLCGGCDHRVHHANKLASKHQRFSLLVPSSKENPLCDICRERRAFLFCQQDRAILCRECDVPIHTANEHTQKHNRFLLTGVKLSATSSVYASASKPGSSSDGCGFVPDLKSPTSIKNDCFVSASKNSPCPDSGNNNDTRFVSGVMAAEISANSGSMVGEDGNGSGTKGSTSSISEYLIEMLPGWHFEDFLDSCSASFGFCKDNSGEITSFSSESLGIRVPRSPPPPLHPSHFSIPSTQPNTKKGSKDGSGGGGATLRATKRWKNNSFTVPEISSPSSTELKRSRQF